MNLRIFPPEEMIETTVTLPLSKSICNRLLTINAMTPGSQPVDPIADCDDSRALNQAFSDLKSGIKEVNIGAAGTAMRFLTAYVAATPALGDDPIIVDGSERMRRRPIAVLVDALQSLGAQIEYAGEEGFPPLKIIPQQLAGGEISIAADVSSQYISALMMVAPSMAQPLTIQLVGEVASRPYITMTAKLMQRAGIDAEFERYTISIPTGTYQPTDNAIEPDWTAASYWYELAAISAGFITLRDLSLESIQGDSRCAKLFEMLGVITSEADPEDYEEPVEGLMVSPSPEQFSRFEVDLTENPDLAQTLAVTAAMLGIPFHLRGLATLKIKETDRLSALQAEFDKLGLIVEVRAGSELVWNGARHPVFEMPRICTYDDHRMAMAFAPAAVFIPGLEIMDADVVSKSYPGFWDSLRDAGFTIEEFEA